MRPYLLPLAALAVLAAPLAAADQPHADPPRPEASAPAPAWLGVGLDKPDDALVYQLDLKDDLGVLVVQVAPGSPAEAMGLKRFDLITGIEGKPAYTVRAVQQVIRGHQPGESLRLEVRRGDKTQVLDGALGKRPPGLEEPPPGFRPPPGFPGHPGHGPRSGQLKRDDGSTLEWQVEEEGKDMPAP